ncbi:hypothetical protein F511_38819 [Dorcoceras hygrometricum]|uniref:Uncharacterized protein n=1 Tax=Dorcoceras hygrometricum TaxID=472368 RepID=A0A2Z7BL87_9LAMI|nr:hypothetical protein F511_38819 [Dorcoceras hygrometricum]
METSKAEPVDRNQEKAKLNRDAYVDSFPYVESYVDSNPYVERPDDRSAKQKMQSAVASIHQLQAISYCKQKSRPAVDTTDGSAGVAGPAGAQRTISWKQMRAVSCKQMSTRSDAKEESESDVEQLIQIRSAKEKINQTLHEEKMKQLVRKDVNNSGVESAVEEVNEPDVVVQLLTYQMFINIGESAVGTTNSKTADEIYKEEPTADERYEENQQLSEQLLNNLLIYIQTQSTA